MNLKNLLKNTGMTLEIIYLLLLIIIIYYLYSICNNVNKEYFTISAESGRLHLSSQMLNDIHENKCNDLFNMIQNGDVGNLELEDIYYIVYKCEIFNELEEEIKNQLRTASNQYNPNVLENLI